MNRLLIPTGALALATALILGACGSTSTTTPSSTTSTKPAATTPEGGGGESAFAFGTPADPATATRTVDITMSGTTFAFEPDSVDVKTGETVKFVVANNSDLQHEFVIGDDATQAEHHQEMAEHGAHGAMADEANGFLLPPHTTKTLAWTFTEAGQVIFGCHVPGHWEGGMRGTVEVSS